MVRLTKIYTKTGDHGYTSLANNTRIGKESDILEAIGSVDEANSAIGMIDQHYDNWLNPIQNDLFDVGAELAGSKTVSITENKVKYLENLIDNLNADLPTLQSFILPKGDIHNARAIVRRAERSLWKLGDINIYLTQYLNRLSDFLFVLARYDAIKITSEILWKPMEENEK